MRVGSWRAFRSTTTYPAYRHTSLNLERQETLTGPRLGILLSLHVQHRWAGGGGFWFGLRPEVRVHRLEQKCMELGEQLRGARQLSQCWRCGREEWGKPGLGLPEDWEYIHTLEFCGECCRTCTVAEIMTPKRSTRCQ